MASSANVNPLEHLPDPPVPFRLPPTGVMSKWDRATVFMFDHALGLALLIGLVVLAGLSRLRSQTPLTDALWASYLAGCFYGQYRKTPLRWRGAWALIPAIVTAGAATIDGWPWYAAGLVGVLALVGSSVWLSNTGTYRRGWEARATRRWATLD